MTESEYPVLADPGLQRPFIRRASVPGGQWPLAHIRRDAHRQPGAWLLLPVGRLRRVDGDLDDRLMGTRACRGRAERCAYRAAYGMDLFAASRFRSASAGPADGRLRVPVPAGGAG